MADRAISVSENSGLGTVGSPLTGTDDDPSQTLTYTLSQAGNSENVFGINSATALVSFFKYLFFFVWGLRWLIFVGRNDNTET